MTEPLKVDTDELDAASAILKSAAGQIPTQLPQFSVNGSDPLSAAIAAGSAQMEAPMAALPWIQANATTTAENIGVAGKRYRETDETLAQKAKEHQFDKNAQEIDGSAQEIKGLSHSQAAIEQLTRTMTEGGATGSPGQKSVTDTLLDNMADGGKAASAGPAGVPESLMPDKTDWILGGASATGQAFADKIAELTRRSLATGGDGASPTLKKLVEEIKIPFTFLGRELPALGSKPGGIVGAIMSIPSVFKNLGEDMPVGQAIAREGASLVVGTAAAVPVTLVPMVGPALAIPTQIFVGNLAANLVDFAWVPLAEAQEAFSESGGPGAAMKAARWGR
jgi:hypothetical protein